MNANRIAAGCLVGLVLGVAVLMLPWSDNVIRDMRRQGWTAAQEKRFRAADDAGADPLVRFAASLTEVPPAAGSLAKMTSYVPAYARIRAGTGRGHIDLATTLSIHNSSRDTPVVIKRVTYHNTEGELLDTYLDRAVALKPLGTIEVFVPAEDLRGGTGANFLVDWASPALSSEPVIEAVMIGTVGTTSYSFVSQARTLRAAVN